MGVWRGTRVRNLLHELVSVPDQAIQSQQTLSVGMTGRIMVSSAKRI